jgi:hypothetical protein
LDKRSEDWTPKLRRSEDLTTSKKTYLWMLVHKKTWDRAFLRIS